MALSTAPSMAQQAQVHTRSRTRARTRASNAYAGTGVDIDTRSVTNTAPSLGKSTETTSDRLDASPEAPSSLQKSLMTRNQTPVSGQINKSTSSSIETQEHCHRSKDGQWYATYTDMVDANKRHNEQLLKAKGLDSRSFRDMQRNAKKRVASSTTAATKSRQSKRMQRKEERRVSRRLARKPCEISTGVDFFFDDNEQRRPLKSRVRPKRKTTNAGADATKLTPSQREQLKQIPEWIPDMHHWLLHIPHGSGNRVVSKDNARQVIRQVTSLANGTGISYPRHWGQGVVFHAGRRVTLSTDFDELFQQAQKMEDEHGRDRGNGWLLRHPIMKMRLYQLHVLENKEASEEV